MGAAAIVSLALAVGLRTVGAELEGQPETIFEGTTVLIAAIVLTGMIFWMRRQGGQMRARLSNKVERTTDVAVAPADGQHENARYGALGLFTIAFLAVLREGVELSLLLVAAAFAASPISVVTGTALGLLTASVVGILLFRGVVRLNLKQFFLITNVLLIVFAAGMVGHGVSELVEAGLLPGIIDPVWNLTGILSGQSLFGQLLGTIFGYHGNPSLTESLAYGGYLAAIGWTLRPRQVADAAVNPAVK